MLKTKIYASKINNLSDARYFAALYVDFLGFQLDGSLSMDQIKEMTDWIEGPQPILEIDGLDSTPSLIDVIAHLNIPIVATSPYFKGYLPPQITKWPSFTLDQIDQAQDHATLIVEQRFDKLDETQMNRIQRLCNSYDLWIDIPFLPQHLNRLLDTFRPYGLRIEGGEEERPGIRSFEDLDEIFEVLSDT